MIDNGSNCLAVLIVDYPCPFASGSRIIKNFNANQIKEAISYN